MTVITSVAACNMCRMLARRRTAIMAGATDTNYLRVIDGIWWRPHVRVVAVLAYIGSLQMCQALARGFHTVVTAHAISRYVDMIKLGRTPAIACMAIVTGIATGNMRWVLAGRHDAVMA